MKPLTARTLVALHPSPDGYGWLSMRPATIGKKNR